MTLSVIEAGPAYGSVIATLHQACFEQAWDEKAITEILTMAGATGLIVQNSEETPLGFMLFRVTADEAEIISIGVEPSARKNGFAGQLLQTSIRRAALEGASRMFLEVAQDNENAISFYEKAGFSIAGRRPDYYHRTAKKIDALIYVREITGK